MPCLAALLEPYDLTGVTVTADALHTQRDHARFLVEEKKAHYLLVVKANQPELHRRLRSLPWKDVTARRYDREIGHGRRETRATRALTVTDLGLDFPHAAQAVRILRHRTDLKSGKCTRQTIYAITDLCSHQASPQRLGQLARSQWTIENRLHFVRDTAFGEDASKIHTGHGPENMATLRNLAINTLREHGHRNIAAGLRHVSYDPFNRPGFRKASMGPEWGQAPPRAPPSAAIGDPGTGTPDHRGHWPASVIKAYRNPTPPGHPSGASRQSLAFRDGTGSQGWSAATSRSDATKERP
ncbi:ISAs1 family transposase [Streptomyces sp. NBC_01205]|uniref:ISAs1 family transposase n=1 Tax=Streptomyces sp. NBC_01205 TaxID=2903771 RepID=UPI002E137981|nr:ISAs1 family transposase [Streptomyces sp. NBC_01205]